MRRSSLTRQLVLPVVGLVLAAVLANVGFAAWLAARRSAAAARAAEARVADSLAAARVSLSPAVLDALSRLTGSRFVVWDEATRAAGLATLPTDDLRGLELPRLVAAREGSVTVGGVPHRFGVVRSGGVRPETVLVLTPARPVLAATLEAVWPALAVAAGTLAVLVPLGLRTTRRLAARIGTVERHVARIAGGEFGHVPAAGDAGPPDDEIGRLVAGVDHLGDQLGVLRSSLVAGERQRLLGQLAAGFAHELRNAVTGARLAIDLHRRRCPAAVAGSPGEESLVVAGRQLEILEEEVRGLLALGRLPETAPAAVAVDRLLEEVGDLVRPRCDHAGVRLDRGPASGLTVTGRRESLRAALVNLALNGIDAAGSGGVVRLTALTRDSGVVLAVDDSGAGPPPDLRESMHEPFVTGKPEGIGLGLTVARAVAEEHGGSLGWERVDGTTRFAIFLPERTLEEGGGRDPPGAPA